MVPYVPRRCCFDCKFIDIVMKTNYTVTLSVIMLQYIFLACFELNILKIKRQQLTTRETFCRHMNWCTQTYQSIPFHIIRSFINGMQHMVASDSTLFVLFQVWYLLTF